MTSLSQILVKMAKIKPVNDLMTSQYMAITTFYVKMDFIFEFSIIELVGMQVFTFPTLTVLKIEISAILTKNWLNDVIQGDNYVLCKDGHHIRIQRH